ncbi:hypothetical protein F0562_024537 [Nyssa sinensis]|uniref:3-beta hydroxysteroid dehydrogenase/isomerase domain-containing protein n=1 Tax=Nyssa sinensis TaxID=561372 RepID=A0A5J5BD04_9ASTE|nr:hypothetical protein F0562_024537 [Nyssa sinensis]
MMAPAVNRTKNVIIAAAEAKVRRVLFMSSIGAVYMDPNRDPDKVVDDSCWSDLQFCKNTENWYCYGKTYSGRASSVGGGEGERSGAGGGKPSDGAGTIAATNCQWQHCSYPKVPYWLGKDLANSVQA